jgi:hypothetical protein
MTQYSQCVEQERIAKIELDKKKKKQEKLESAMQWNLEI